ncbi:MAG: ABC transporter substrate-binding protein, partial [Clostridia bacterium]|nr:ABC transporter substrate-binding protein [Clostridia bacterium]
FSSYYTVDEADEMSSLKTDLDTYKKEWRGYFISGQKSLETDWDEYVAGYNGLNLDRFLEIYRSAREQAAAE